MVIALLALPIVLVALLYGIDLVTPGELVAGLAMSPVFVAVLSVLTLAAILAAAWRVRDNPHLMSAWLFLFCGVVILALSSLVDTFAAGSESWTEELLSAAAFFPLLFFAVLVASPLRLLMISRRQRLLYTITGLIVFLGVCALVLVPWLVATGGPREHASVRHLLRLAQPVLDTVLVEPVALLVILIGITGGGAPYVLVGIGLALLIPDDVVGHMRLLQELDTHSIVSDILSITSALYLLGGALLAIFQGRRGPEKRRRSSRRSDRDASTNDTAAAPPPIPS